MLTTKQLDDIKHYIEGEHTESLTLGDTYCIKLHSDACEIRNAIREAIVCIGDGCSPLAVRAAKSHLKTLLK